MKALKITETKNFMGILLKSDCFEDFLLAEASITTYNTFTIDGHIVPAFYKGDVNVPDEEASYQFPAGKTYRSFASSSSVERGLLCASILHSI